MCKLGSIAAVALVCGVGVAQAADYYVATTGNDQNDGKSATTPFATITKAVVTARTAGDVIHVAPGDYKTVHDGNAEEIAKWGPNLCVKMIGEGATRDEVTITAEGHRTLRTANGAWIENMTLIGEPNNKADKGGVLEMSGGTVTNCVIRNGTASSSSKQAGGCLYMNNDAALVVDCEISGGKGNNHGGNVCLLKGTLRSCTITGGVTASDGEEKWGANIYMEGGRVDTCTISDGDGYEGGEVYMRGGMITGSTILANGTTRGSGGGIYMTNGTVENSTVDADGFKEMAWHGGCIYMKNGTVRNTICKNGTCTNADSREGGNIYMEKGTLENVTLENGTSWKDGGNLRLAGGTINGLTCLGGTSNVGGNIYMTAGTLTNVTCEDGSAKGEGGNIYMKSGSITGLVCTGGMATSNGGNIRMGDSASITDATIANGTVVADGNLKGANIYMDGSAKLIRAKVTGGTSLKADKTTVGYDRGSICANSASTVIDNCLVADSSCGGILLETTGHLYNTTIVNNDKYGIWSWNALQVFQNCVIFGNYNGEKTVAKDYAGNIPSGEGSAFLNCAVDVNDTRFDSESSYPTKIDISAEDFADYAKGDYRPSGESSKLFNAGAVDSRTDASLTDLAGKKRLVEDLDIGCYELQLSAMTVAVTPLVLEHGYAPADVSFSVSAENAPGEVTYVIDFGDGNKAETTKTEITHTYSDVGSYTISVSAKSGEEVTRKSSDRTFTLVEKTRRVSENGSIADALVGAVAGCEVLLEGASYTVENPIVVNTGITLKPAGEGLVTIRNTVTAHAGSTNHRVMEVSGGATVENVIFENGSILGGVGGCVTVNGATLSNCVIRGGTATKGETGNVGGAGVALYASAKLTHCTITGNTVTGTSDSDTIFSGAVYVVHGQKPVTILNCLIADNRYVCTPGADVKSGSAGLVFGGENETSLVENCTIAGNVVEGALKEDSAGLHCTTWSANLRNTVVAGNFETAKGEKGAYTAAKIDTAHCSVANMMTDDAEALNASSFVSTVSEMFKNFEGHNYQPKTQGALWNKGLNTSTVEATDLLGKPRVMFDVIDLGCYEAQHKLSFMVTIR